jgi:hypothetical protein
MTNFRAQLLICLGLTLVSFAQSENAKPVLSKDPLTAEQIAVYQAFLRSYNNGSDASLNLANKTVPLDLSDLPADSPCLKGIKLENVQAARLNTHLLDASLAVKGRVALVDPEQQRDKVKSNDPHKTMPEGKSAEDAVAAAFASGLLTLSEVVFDKDHHWAVMSFGFYCGRLCGHGGTIVLQKVGQEWKVTARHCDEWIS